jgi:AbiV family abortive infection protein
MAVSEGALKAVAANAVRHLIEADQHYKAGRYPSATVSAAISIEEIGKLGFLAATGSSPKKETRYPRGSFHRPHKGALKLAMVEGLDSISTRCRGLATRPHSTTAANDHRSS